MMAQIATIENIFFDKFKNDVDNLKRISNEYKISLSYNAKKSNNILCREWEYSLNNYNVLGLRLIMSRKLL